MSNDSFDALDLYPDEREVLRRTVFVEPVPNVTRVIYLSTPHHGSYVAGSWIAHQAARLVTFPANVTRIGTDLLTRNRARLNPRFSGVGTSVLGMTPGSSFIGALSSIPTLPGVKAHSIIAVTDPDEPRQDATDGVVACTSAHVDGVESEYVVASGHSCQDNPHTIQEVRRILLEHIAAFDAAQRAPRGAAESNAGGGERARCRGSGPAGGRARSMTALLRVILAIPVVLVAAWGGLLGVNVGGIPGTNNEWGFAVVTAVLLAIGGGVAWLLRARRLF